MAWSAASLHYASGTASEKRQSSSKWASETEDRLCSAQRVSWAQSWGPSPWLVNGTLWLETWPELCGMESRVTVPLKGVCVSVCLSVCMCMSLCMCLCVYAYLCCVSVCFCVCMCVSVCMCACVCVCMCIFLCVCVCMSVYVCLYLCVCWGRVDVGVTPNRRRRGQALSIVNPQIHSAHSKH